MKLRTRLLLFFQGALALVLVGFSCSLYVLVSKHEHNQADERLDSALNTLAAAAEVSAAGVEWEPEERSLAFGRSAAESALVWRVADDLGDRVDGSGGDAEHVFDLPDVITSSRRLPVTTIDRAGGHWRVMDRRLTASERSAVDPASGEEDPPATGRIYSSLVLTTGVSLDGTYQTLNRLRLTLIGLSSGLWVAMLSLGGRLCRQALRPVSAMADAAKEIGGGHHDRRLPVPPTGDELDDFGRSFNALLDRLQESYERQRRFTGDASHQLRTPLTTMLGNVDVALARQRTPEEYEQVLTLVQRKARQMRGMIEALLFLARADRESLHPDLDPLELSSWLEDFLHGRYDAKRGADIRLERNAGGPIVVQTHQSLLGDLLENLLENAGRYSEPGTPIAVHLGGDANSTAITVTDQGIGVDEGDLPHLFEPFFRSRSARGRAATGVGLGLSIADRLAKAIGVTIEVSSRVGEGSSFTIRWRGDAS